MTTNTKTTTTQTTTKSQTDKQAAKVLKVLIRIKAGPSCRRC